MILFCTKNFILFISQSDCSNKKVQGCYNINNHKYHIMKYTRTNSVLLCSVGVLTLFGIVIVNTVK